jgi:uncharacterized tellurite resistance protein B-like protein
MIRSLKKFVSELSATPAKAPSADDISLAMAALLVETARADFEVRSEEMSELGDLLVQKLGVSPEDASSLVRRAQDAVERSVSLYEFTRPLHEGLSYSEKEEVVRMLWHVALADRRLDRYEDYLIGKVSQLLYVARGDVIRLKHEVLQHKPANTGGD